MRACEKVSWKKWMRSRPLSSPTPPKTRGSDQVVGFLVGGAWIMPGEGTGVGAGPPPVSSRQAAPLMKKIVIAQGVTHAPRPHARAPHARAEPTPPLSNLALLHPPRHKRPALTDTHTHTQRLPFRLKTSAQERQREGERARSSLSLHFFFPSPRGAGRRAQASGPPHAGALSIFLRGRGPPLKKGFVNTSKAWWCEVLATGLPAAVVAGGGGRCPARQRGG